jgi:hypothetical protein
VRLARLGLIVPLLLLANLVRATGGLPDAPAARSNGMPVIPAESRAASFSFAAGVTEADRAALASAIASARPEAQRLIAVVDGMTTVTVGADARGAAGTATDFGDRYELRLDLGMVGRMGPRAVARLVLHELGHVVDYALIDDALMARLDAGIPEGWVCEEGNVGSCAEKEERFAETFAKWATGDLGVDIYLGYKVPPPAMPLDVWGAPLTGLGA